MKNCKFFNEGTALVTYQLKCLLRNFWWCGLLKRRFFAIVYTLVSPHLARFCNYLLALHGVFHTQHACIQQNLDMLGLAPWHPEMRG